MQIPLQITIRDVSTTEVLANQIRKKTDKLEQICQNIISCSVVVELSQNSQHQGKIYDICINLSVPGEDIVINKVKNENVFIAVRDAFLAARRRLLSKTRKQRGEVKNHIPLTHGYVSRKYPEEDYGFIESLDGRDFYFHRNNVAYPDFDQLEIGTQVQFMEVTANEGLQANRVSAGKHSPLTSESENNIEEI